MQNKRARKQNREIWNTKSSREITQQKRDFNKLCNHFDSVLKHTRKDVFIPKGVSPSHWLIFNKAFQTALRENTDILEEIKCPSCKKMSKVHVMCTNEDCGKEVLIKYPREKLEKNSLDALSLLADRMVPKLQSVSHEVNIQGTITNISAKLINVIIKHVPKANKVECMQEVSGIIEEEINKENEVGAIVNATKTE